VKNTCGTPFPFRSGGNLSAPQLRTVFAGPKFKELLPGESVNAPEKGVNRWGKNRFVEGETATGKR